MWWKLTLILALTGCQPHSPPDEDSGEATTVNGTDFSGCELREEVSICHHPGTVFHDRECNGEIYPKGCYVAGDETAFCWTLRVETCGDQSDEWEGRYCPMLIDCR